MPLTPLNALQVTLCRAHIPEVPAGIPEVPQPGLTGLPLGVLDQKQSPGEVWQHL